MKQQTTETTADASSTDEIQMDTNGDGVVDELDEATATETETPTDTGHQQKKYLLDTWRQKQKQKHLLDTEATETETTTDASSADEIQMDTNGDGVVDELDTPSSETSTAADEIRRYQW